MNRIPESDDEFRFRLRTYLKERHPGKAPKDVTERLAWQKAWLGQLVDDGYAGPSWPREYGGMDLPFPQQVIYAEESGRARVPGSLGTGVGIAGPTIIRYGSDEQRARWLKPMLRGDEVWAQGYSEPDAGSDLTALRTRAQRNGDSYVLNGTKVWSSHAEIADVLFCLVRTGSLEDRERGITYLLVETATPGVTIRPIRDMTGRAEFCEVMFEDAVVPLANRIGEENEGWPIARTSLGHERSALALNQAGLYRRVVDELIALARERGLGDDPVVRQRLAAADIGVRLLWMGGARTISEVLTKGEPGGFTSVSRLQVSLFEQRLHELAVNLLGPYGTLAISTSDAIQRGRWVFGFLRTRASTIGAGTAEIQRNTAAERVLGLPREPQPT